MADAFDFGEVLDGAITDELFEHDFDGFAVIFDGFLCFGLLAVEFDGVEAVFGADFFDVARDDGNLVRHFVELEFKR